MTRRAASPSSEAGSSGSPSPNACCARTPSAQVTVLEKEQDWARHQTGRNSGVVHSGLYYPPGTLKAHVVPRRGDRPARTRPRRGRPPRGHRQARRRDRAVRAAPAWHALVRARPWPTGSPSRRLTGAGGARARAAGPRPRGPARRRDRGRRLPRGVRRAASAGCATPAPRSATGHRGRRRAAGAGGAGRRSRRRGGEVTARRRGQLRRDCTPTGSPGSSATGPPCGSCPSGASTAR